MPTQTSADRVTALLPPSPLAPGQKSLACVELPPPSLPESVSLRAPYVDGSGPARVAPFPPFAQLAALHIALECTFLLLNSCLLHHNHCHNYFFFQFFVLKVCNLQRNGWDGGPGCLLKVCFQVSPVTPIYKQVCGIACIKKAPPVGPFPLTPHHLGYPPISLKNKNLHPPM